LYLTFGIPGKQGYRDTRYEYSAMLHIAEGETEDWNLRKVINV